MPLEPLARRAVMIDSSGNYISNSNPLAVSVTNANISVDVDVNDKVSVFQATASDLNARTYGVDTYARSSTLAYDTSNNVTQILGSSAFAGNKTTLLYYNTSNNCTRSVTTI